MSIEFNELEKIYEKGVAIGHMQGLKSAIKSIDIAFDFFKGDKGDWERIVRIIKNTIILELETCLHEQQSK
jgi:hypothetical protein